MIKLSQNLVQYSWGEKDVSSISIADFKRNLALLD